MVIVSGTLAKMDANDEDAARWRGITPVQGRVSLD